jgi:outer membrane protein assembly factor BamB
VALDLATGRPVVGWSGAKLEDERFVATPALDAEGRRLYAITEDGDVHTIELATGVVSPTLARIDDRVWASPAVAGRTLYVGSLDRRLVSVEPGSGAVAERAAFPVAGDLAIDGDLLLVNGFDRRLHAYDLGSGSERWASAKSQSWLWAQPLVDRGTVYSVDVGGTVLALDRASGTERWRAPSKERGEVRAAPALSQEVLVVATRDGWLVGLNASDGTELWAQEAPGRRFVADPLVVESGVLYVTEGGTLLRVTPATGATTTLYVPPA